MFQTISCESRSARIVPLATACAQEKLELHAHMLPEILYVLHLLEADSKWG